MPAPIHRRQTFFNHNHSSYQNVIKPQILASQTAIVRFFFGEKATRRPKLCSSPILKQLGLYTAATSGNWKTASGDLINEVTVDNFPNRFVFIDEVHETLNVSDTVANEVSCRFCLLRNCGLRHTFSRSIYNNCQALRC